MSGGACADACFEPSLPGSGGSAYRNLAACKTCTQSHVLGTDFSTMQIHERSDAEDVAKVDPSHSDSAVN